MTHTPGIRCVFCARVTLNPAAFIADKPVGPSCARKHNMMPLAGRAPGSHGIRFTSGKGGRAQGGVIRDAKTRDLFEGVAA
jgi:hypothetical protein